MKLGIRLLPLLVAVVGCSAQAENEVQPEDVSAQSSALVAGACSQEHYIGMLPPLAPSCPTIVGKKGKYVGTKLFETAALKSFCKYDWSPYAAGTAPDSDPKVDPRPSGDPDCNVVGPLGADSSPQLLSPLHDATLKQAGALASLPGAPSAVRVAVIDTSPSALEPVAGNSPHGYSVERVIREISCPSGGACVGQVESRLGLPQLTVDKSDSVNGGYFGTQAQLAKAIADAVDAWSARRQHGRGEPKRLVINLSVGWDAGRGYETIYTMFGTRLSYPASAVLQALRHASCKGAITIAAAGNKTGTPETGGAMYPAAWEKIEAPSRAECESMEGAGYFEEVNDAIFPTTGMYRPVLWGASGVDATDRALPTTRKGGNARLVAYGDEVVALDGGGYSKNLTGSSMAAAIVSGTAAAAWGYAPTVTPAQLMMLVYARGVDLTTNAPSDVSAKTPGFCLGASCDTMTMRRESLASTLTALTGKPVGETVSAYNGTPAKMPTDWSPVDPGFANPKSIDMCPNGACSLPSSSMLTSGAEPWVNPQPGSVGCDVCGLTYTGSLYLIIGGLYVNQPATLAVKTTSGTTYYAVKPTSTTTSYQLANAGSITGASLSFDNGGLATTEPLMMLK